jgi:hypothetical protein
MEATFITSKMTQLLFYRDLRLSFGIPTTLFIPVIALDYAPITQYNLASCS